MKVTEMTNIRGPEVEQTGYNISVLFKTLRVYVYSLEAKMLIILETII